MLQEFPGMCPTLNTMLFTVFPILLRIQTNYEVQIIDTAAAHP